MRPTRLTIPACIGCGAMRVDGSCPGACVESRVDLVSGADYDQLAAAAAARRGRLAGLRAVLAELARTEPRPGEWQAVYGALQRSARAALRHGPAAAPAGADEPFPAASPVPVWRCEDCGGLDAAQPCIGVCIWRPAAWVTADRYAREREQALADLATERSLAGLLRRVAFATPRAGQWERSWRALQAQAQQVLA